MRTLDLCYLKEMHCYKLWKIKKNIKKAVLKSREPPKFLLKKPKNVIKGCNSKNLWSRMWSCLEFRRFFAGIKIAVNTLYTWKSEKTRENKRKEEILANLLLVWVTRLELAASTTPIEKTPSWNAFFESVFFLFCKMWFWTRQHHFAVKTNQWGNCECRVNLFLRNVHFVQKKLCSFVDCDHKMILGGISVDWQNP